jgi:ATP-dependent DNA helicase RecQ
MENLFENEGEALLDPIAEAVNKLFGLPYLFPYQRLVVSNILEAAKSAGVGLRHLDTGSTGENAAAEKAQAEEAAGIAKENPCLPTRARDRSGIWTRSGQIGADSPVFAGEPAKMRPNFETLDEEAPYDEAPEKEAAGLGRQIVILPTGAGKSLCFQFPAMLLDGPTLVIYPILSLMADQERRLLEKDFAPVTLRGGQSEEERAVIWQKIKNKESRFIIANPEVLLTPKVLKILPELGIVHIVIDEAHCVSEWGESFRPSYLEIGKVVEAAEAPIVTAFTATASAPVLEKIGAYLFGEQGAHQIAGNPDRSNISYASVGAIVRDMAVRDLLTANLRPAIVFCSSRPGTEKLARYLRAALGDREIRFYHAGLERAEKSDVEKWFFSSETGILVATCAYGMGVDKANVRTVIHRDFPPSVEAYLQESGRAGRDGGFSRAFLIWGPDDERTLARAKTEYDAARLKALMAYARDITHCRREALLAMLNYDSDGQKPESECCDVCAGRGKAAVREHHSVHDFFRRGNRAFTEVEAAAILGRAPAVNWSPAEAKLVIRGLQATGVLRELKRFPWKGKLAVVR